MATGILWLGRLWLGGRAMLFCRFFFFQAEDGIRDYKVTGVQTCALPILAKALFPRFRSGEHKPGTHRPDLPAGVREIKTIELPLVGGPSFILTIVGTGIGAAYFLHFSQDQWTLLLIALGATLGYTLVGFIDDWGKVYRNSGLSELTKF